MTARNGARSGARDARVRLVLAELGFTGPGVTGWREQAECRMTDPELFYPLTSEGEAAAVQVCAGCPVRDLCLADVMASEDPGSRWGVVGGLGPVERAELFAAQRRAVA